MEGQWIAGIDEVGRGALLGPVVAAAVILPPTMLADLTKAGVRDSKLLSSAKRSELAVRIREVAIDAQIGMASVQEIDRLNILQASLLAMKRAILRLTPQPTLCLIDGNQLISNLGLPQQAIVKGDQSSIQIAAASILAKVWRDTLLIRLHRRYPGYDLASNKGYGSPNHRAAIATLGISRQHRLSFKGCQPHPIPFQSDISQISLPLHSVSPPLQ